MPTMSWSVLQWLRYRNSCGTLVWMTVQQRTRPWIWIRALASMTVALGLTGCATEPQTRLGAVGVEAEVGDLALRDVELANPPDGRYEVGSAARLNLAIVNRGRDDDQLTDVSGPAFDAVVVDDGEPDTPLQITIPAGETVFTGQSGDADLILTGIDTSLLSSETISVTLSFQRSGDVTVEAVVSAPLRLTLDRYLREQTTGSAPMTMLSPRPSPADGGAWRC